MSTSDDCSILSTLWPQFRTPITSAPCCQPPLVTCDKKTSITSINIAGIGATGIVPPGLANFSNLIELRLDNNKLTGNLSPELGRLVSLKVLSAQNNLLNGRLPPSFGAMRNLTILNLSNNQVSGTIPKSFKKLLNLQIVFLDGNTDLIGPVPSEWSRLNISTSTTCTNLRNARGGRQQTCCNLENLCVQPGTKIPDGCVANAPICPASLVTEDTYAPKFSTTSISLIAGVIVAACVFLVWAMHWKKARDDGKQSEQASSAQNKPQTAYPPSSVPASLQSQTAYPPNSVPPHQPPQPAYAYQQPSVYTTASAALPLTTETPTTVALPQSPIQHPRANLVEEPAPNGNAVSVNMLSLPSQAQPNYYQPSPMLQGQSQYYTYGQAPGSYSPHVDGGYHLGLVSGHPTPYRDAHVSEPELQFQQPFQGPVTLNQNKE